jgi:hypothetical protein
LSRLFVPDIQRIVLAEGIVPSISCSHIWRILDEDALKPWRHRSWIYPRDPKFYERAAPALDLYQGVWRGMPLGPRDYVISADEKTGLQVLRRIHPTQMGADGRGLRVEHEYVREGVWAYHAAMDIFQPRLMGRVELTTGVEPFMRLVHSVMQREPYASARRVFWIVDGGSSHHRSTFPRRLRKKYRNAIAVMLPVHGSWVNQIESYFSIVERKVLTPRDFTTRQQAAQRLRDFEKVFNRTAKPFRWNYTRADLREFLRSLEMKSTQKIIRPLHRRAQ